MTEVGIRCVGKNPLFSLRDAGAAGAKGMRWQRTTGAARDEYEERYSAATNNARWIAIYRKVIEAV